MAPQQLQGCSGLGIHSEKIGLLRPGGQGLLWAGCVFSRLAMARLQVAG